MSTVYSAVTRDGWLDLMVTPWPPTTWVQPRSAVEVGKAGSGKFQRLRHGQPVGAPVDEVAAVQWCAGSGR